MKKTKSSWHNNFLHVRIGPACRCHLVVEGQWMKSCYCRTGILLHVYLVLVWCGNLIPWSLPKYIHNAWLHNNSDLAALKLGLPQLDVQISPLNFTDFMRSLKIIWGFWRAGGGDEIRAALKSIEKLGFVLGKGFQVSSLLWNRNPSKVGFFV